MKFLKAGLWIGLSILLYLVLRDAFPKYAGAMKVYLALWILDGYLWISTGASLRRRGPGFLLLGGFFYWLPLLMILGGMLYGWFVPFLDWNILFRTELLNLIQIGYAVKVIPILGRLFADARKLIFGDLPEPGVYGVRRVKKTTRVMTVTWSLGGLTGLILLAGHLFGQYTFELKRVNLSLYDLPASFEGYRIVQISDLHLGNWNCPAKLDEAVDRVNRLKPDLLFVTGDVATFSTVDAERFRTALSRLRARDGIFVIYGNHDYGQYYKYKDLKEVYDNMDRFAALYRDLGWILLNNEQRVITRKSDSIAILGVENWGAEARFPKLADIVSAEKGTENIATKLLLSHDPTYWEMFIAPRHPEVDVTFSGHTHGGQIGIELHGLKFSLVSMLHPYWAGLYADSTGGATRYLYVNRGLGTVGYEGRIGISPEITLFFLHRRER